MGRFVFLLVFLVLGAAFADERWVAYYDDKAPIEAFDPYSVIVLDTEYHPSLQALKEEGKTLLGYLNLGEVEKIRFWYPELKREGLLLGENKNWPGSYFIDIRDPRWAKRVIEELIPLILFMGFDGLFLDTLDDAEFLENENPRVYAGMKEAAIHLVEGIRLHYPQVPLMLNRAYFTYPKAAKLVNIVLGEDVMTKYDFKTKKYVKQPKSVYEEQVKVLKEAKKFNDKLKVFTLDYWNPKQTGVIKEIYQTERENGFVPYVGTIDLNKIIPEP